MSGWWRLFGDHGRSKWIWKELKRAEKSMERTKTKFIEAHQTTMEVLKASGEVEISSERFNKKGEK